jgi:glutaminyl-peptide cyclotransferase
MFAEEKAWSMLTGLARRGKRAPGTEEHKQSIEYLFGLMKGVTTSSWLQPFSLFFQGNTIECANICGHIPGKDSSSTLLIGSHFDTRWIADNEADPEKRNLPIPGVNDGTSGVVIILELARVLKEHPPSQDVVFVLFDAEDVGNIDGYEFSVGADHYAQSGKILPNSVIALDMVGGKNMHLNIDLHSMALPESKKIFTTLFTIGRDRGYPCFFNNTVNMIISDHYPFLKRNIPSCILIDIGYPQWHTHSDTIEYCSKDSLKYIGDVLYFFVTNGEIH